MTDLRWTRDVVAPLLEGRRAGNIWPYTEGSDADVEEFVDRVASNLTSAHMDADRGECQLASGYTSFAAALCIPRGTARLGELNGIAVWISTRGPFAVWAPLSVERSKSTVRSDVIDFDRLYVTPEDERRVFVPDIERILRSFDVALPPAGTLQEPVASESAPGTLLPALRGDSTFRLFDLLFQWTD